MTVCSNYICTALPNLLSLIFSYCHRKIIIFQTECPASPTASIGILHLNIFYTRNAFQYFPWSRYNTLPSFKMTWVVVSNFKSPLAPLFLRGVWGDYIFKFVGYKFLDVNNLIGNILCLLIK